MRLFTAIKPDRVIKNALSDIQNQMKAAGVSGNYTKAENLHITLAFIGEYGKPEKVLEALNSVPFSPFEIALDKTGSFGPLWWCGIKDPAPLEEYAANIRSALDKAGIPYDCKKFSAHITLIRKPDKYAIPKIAIPRAKMTAGKASLFKSERTANGMLYTEIV